MQIKCVIILNIMYSQACDSCIIIVSSLLFVHIGKVKGKIRYRGPRSRLVINLSLNLWIYVLIAKYVSTI